MPAQGNDEAAASGGCCGPSEPRAGQSRPGAFSRRRSWLLGAGERCGSGAQRIKPLQLPTPRPLLPFSTPPLRESPGIAPPRGPPRAKPTPVALATPPFSFRLHGVSGHPAPAAEPEGAGRGARQGRKCRGGGRREEGAAPVGAAVLCSPLGCVEKRRYAPESGGLGRTPLPPDLSPFLQTHSELIVFSGEQNIPQPKPQTLFLPDLTASSKLS